MKAWPGFQAESGIFDEHYREALPLATMEARYQHHTAQCERYFNAQTQLIVTYPAGSYEGKANEKLWEEVLEYIEAVYDTEFLKKVYISVDGAEWLKAGKEFSRNSELVLDRFHLMKYINQSVSHLKEGKEREREGSMKLSMEGIRNRYRRYLQPSDKRQKVKARRRSKTVSVTF